MDKAGKWIGIGVGIVLLITIGFIVAASLYPTFREISRDVAIVILAVFHLIAALLIIVLLFAVLYAVKSIHKLTHNEVVPKINIAVGKVDELLDNTRVIVSHIRDSTESASVTTNFVAEQVASPIIRVSSVVAGVRAAASTLAHRGNGKESKEQSETPNV